MCFTSCSGFRDLYANQHELSQPTVQASCPLANSDMQNYLAMHFELFQNSVYIPGIDTGVDSPY